MNMNIQKISLVFMFICIITLFVENRNMNNKFKSLENFGNDNIEHLTNTDENRVREIVKEEYNHDIEAIRNLGAISKSLLTGKNYHSSDITLSSTAYFKSPGVLCYSRDPNDQIDSLIGSAFNDEEAKSACSNEITCKGFSSSQAGGYTFYNNIQSVSNRYAEEGDSCFQKQEKDGDLQDNILTIPANVRILGNITVDGNAIIDGNAEIGPAYIGHHTGTKDPNGNWAQFSHKNRKDGNRNFALLQKNDGETVLNRSNGKLLQVRENNEMKGGMDIGTAYVGSSRSAGTGWAEFSHIERAGNGEYSFLSHSDGRTNINTIGDSGFRSSKNNYGGIPARYVELRSNTDWMHFRNMRIYSSTGEDLINKKDSNGSYIIPDQNFVEVGKNWNDELHQNRKAHYIRHPYSTNDDYRQEWVGGNWEKYFHSSGGSKTWRVDLGKSYEIVEVSYNYRTSMARQTGGGDDHDRLVLINADNTETFNESIRQYNKVDIGIYSGDRTTWFLDPQYLTDKIKI